MPASYAFSIWGLIYILLGVFTIHQAIPTYTPGKKLIFGEINSWFVINMTLNWMWLVIY